MPIKWVIDEEYFGDKDIHCSGCGAVIHADEWASHDWLYCYNCGGEAENPYSVKVLKGEANDGEGSFDESAES